METLHVVNIKCHGCAHKIQTALENLGMTAVTVSPDEQTVKFEGDRQRAKAELEKLGYPEAGSEAAASLLKKARSFVSCALGRMDR